jgi:hypothetical protein
MKKLLSASAFLIFFNCIVLGQQTSESSKPAGTTSFYAELGGPGLVFSANLDKRFKNSHLGLGGRAGVGFASSYEETIRNGNTDYRDVSVVTFPLQLNYIFGRNESPHTFEVGAGVTIAGRNWRYLIFTMKPVPPFLVLLLLCTAGNRLQVALPGALVLPLLLQKDIFSHLPELAWVIIFSQGTAQPVDFFIS